MSKTTTQTTSKSKTYAPYTSKQHLNARVDTHEKMISIILGVLVVSFLLLVVDLYMDRSVGERLDSYILENSNLQIELLKEVDSASDRNTDLTQEFNTFKKCLQLGGWQKCF